MTSKIESGISAFDKHIIAGLQKISRPLARVSIFIVFFWFGILKIFMTSPANPLVAALQQKTLPWFSFEAFITFFGCYEMVIGLLFLIPKMERAAIALLIPHMITTVMPLVLLPQVTWQTWFVPTLEGQYILKNVVIVALALSIGSQLHPLTKNWLKR